jgi:malate dehydrogenase (oxaloacetate-decarboxylating)
MLVNAGVRDIIACDRHGAIARGDDALSPSKAEFAEWTNPRGFRGTADEALAGADVFLGLSGPGAITAEGVRTMADGAIVFAMANPTPEVQPEEIDESAAVIATGRSDYPNQINNVLAFPGIFRGALDAGAPRITEEMKLAAAKGIAMAVTEEDLSEDYIIPSVFNREVAPKVAEAVVEEAKRAGIARFSEETGTFSTVDVG